MTKFPMVAVGLALLMLAGCSHRQATVPAQPTAPQASPTQPYINIEPSRKSPRSGSLEVKRTAGEKEIGISFYPKASVSKSGIVQGPKGAVAGAVLQTTQPYADVVKFYRGKYGVKKPVLKTMSDATGATTMLNWQETHGNYTVVIKRDDTAKQTTITLVKTSK